MAVLYRKYRPTKLENVVGQEQVTKVLTNAIAQDKVAHAFLLIGPRGTGKTSVARILAHAVNGFDYQVEDNYLDIIEIDAASNTGVDNIRELREKAIIAPTKGKYKVYIIDEVHMLTKSASNALLKTLEEPPEHVIFIMATTDAHKIPITISSRAQVHTFKLASPEIMLPHLQKIAKSENINISDDALKIVIHRGGGSFRDSLSLLDQVASLASQDSREITADALSRILGLPQDETIRELLASFAAQDSAKIQVLIKDLLNTGIRPEIIASELIEAIIANPQPAFLPLLATLPEVAAPFPEAKLLLALLSSQTSAPTSQNVVKNTTFPPETPPKMNASTLQRQTPAHASIREVTNPPTNASFEPAAPEAISLRPPLTADNFTWEAFLERVRDMNVVVCGHLSRADYEFDGQTLHLYPLQAVAKSILEKPNNRQILMNELGKIPLIIHDIGEKKSSEDPQLSQISAIMGNIQEVKGDLPF